MRIIYTAFFLLVSTAQLITSSELSEPLELSRRAAIAENPLVQFAKYVDSTFFQKSLTDEDFQTRISKEDPLQVFLNFLALSQENRINNLKDKIAEVGNDIEAIAKLVNVDLGGRVLVVSNGTLRFDADGIAKVIDIQATGCIRDVFKDNRMLQITLTQAVRGEIRKQLPELRKSLQTQSLPLGDIQKLIAASTGGLRFRRDSSSNIFTVLVQSYLKAILEPIYTSFVNLCDNATSVILNFYVKELPSNQFLQLVTNATNKIVVQAAQCITVVRGYSSVVYYSLVNGTDSSRRRRDAEFELQDYFKVLDVDDRGLDLHGRSKRSTTIISTITSAISSVFSFIWKVIKTVFSALFGSVGTVVTYVVKALWTVLKTIGSSLWSLVSSSFNIVSAIYAYVTGGIWGLISYIWEIISEYANTALKEWFVSFISGYYEEIGEWVTYPVRWLVQCLINLMFPCDSCESIV